MGCNKKLPSLPVRILNYAEAMFRYAQSGFKKADTELYEGRLAVCQKPCPSLVNGYCAECGCPVHEKALQYVQMCPLRLWPGDPQISEEKKLQMEQQKKKMQEVPREVYTPASEQRLLVDGMNDPLTCPHDSFALSPFIDRNREPRILTVKVVCRQCKTQFVFPEQNGAKLARLIVEPPELHPPTLELAPHPQTLEHTPDHPHLPQILNPEVPRLSSD